MRNDLLDFYVFFNGTDFTLTDSLTYASYVSVGSGWNYITVSGLSPNSLYVGIDRTNTQHIIDSITGTSQLGWMWWESGQTAYKCGVVFVPQSDSVVIKCEHSSLPIYKIAELR